MDVNIPKTINYCWFGNNDKPKEFTKYLKSWETNCPDYRIVEWNENNFDYKENAYCRQAYMNKKWAFVSDYARLKIIYEYGGVYLDTDIELLKPLDSLLKDNKGFLGYQDKFQIASGLGFAAPRGNECIKSMLDIYNMISFVNHDGSLNLTPCPVMNTVALRSCGVMEYDCKNKIQEVYGIRVLPVDYLNPLDINRHKLIITNNTYSIHHYQATWLNSKQTFRQRLKRLFPATFLEKRALYKSRNAVERLMESLKITGCKQCNE